MSRSGWVGAAAMLAAAGLLCGAAALRAARSTAAAAAATPAAATSTSTSTSSASLPWAVAQAKPLTKETSGCWPWPDSMDAVKADPQNHTVLYEDENVRFLDVHTPAHTINSKHDHQWLSVFLQEEAQPLGQDHGTDGTAGAPGGVVAPNAHFPLLNIAGTQAPHAFENLDYFNKHFYRAELKRIPFECPAPNGAMTSYNKDRLATLPPAAGDGRAFPAAMDATVTSPETDVVRFENFDIRLVEVIIAPGQKQKLGAQLYPSALIFYQPQPKGTMTFETGQAMAVARKFEKAKFPQAIRESKQAPHAFENQDGFPAHYYRIEFKKIDYQG